MDPNQLSDGFDNTYELSLIFWDTEIMQMSVGKEITEGQSLSMSLIGQINHETEEALEATESPVDTVMTFSVL